MGKKKPDGTCKTCASRIRYEGKKPDNHIPEDFRLPESGHCRHFKPGPPAADYRLKKVMLTCGSCKAIVDARIIETWQPKASFWIEGYWQCPICKDSNLTRFSEYPVTTENATTVKIG